MRHLACLLWLAALLFSPLAALADSTSLLSQASAANPTRYQFAINKSAEIRSTSDNKAFTIWWQPAAGTPTGVLVTLHGHGSYATDEFYLWQPYLQARGYAILALQWWFGGGETVADYYLPQDMYPIIASLLKEKGVKPGTVLLHGYSRGSANSYAVTAQDTSSGNRYINMTLSNSGGAAASFPPNQQIVAGSYGILPFSGIQWVMYCGELDPDPSINGCPAMTSAKTWVTQYGATVKLLMDDPSGGHGGFMLSSANVNTALAQFTPAPRTPTAPSTADCLFNWAEKSFPQYFAPTGSASQTSTPYYFRYYAATGNYLASNAADNHLWALGLATGGKLLDLGLAAAFLGSAGCSAP
jgi:hypothetical protein